MMRYLNYEQAVKMLDSEDAFMVRACSRLQQILLSNSEIQPVSSFDMLYFFSSMVRVLANACGHTPSVQTVCQPQHAIHRPDFSDSDWSEFAFVSQGLASLYANIVEAESAEDGHEFDIEFACRIAVHAFDAESIDWLRDGVGQQRDPTCRFDTWLGGFNTPTRIE